MRMDNFKLLFDSIIIFINQLIILVNQKMADRSMRSTRKSKISHTSLMSKPGFRVIYKSRSGILENLNESGLTYDNKIKQCQNTETQILYSNYSQSKANNWQDSQASFNSTRRDRLSKTIQHGFKQSIENPQKIQKKLNLPVIEQNPYEQQQQMQNLQQLSLDEVQNMLNDLLQAKLQSTYQSINKEFKQQTLVLDKKIQEIVSYLEKSRSENQSLDTKNRKINILEKLIAEKSVESDIAKKFFMKRVNNRKIKLPDQYKSRINVQDIKQQTKKLLNRNPPPSVHCQSTSQGNYKSPDINAYPKKVKKIPHEFDCQPMPRSSYARDYLQYRNLPKYQHKQYPTKLIPPVSMGKKNSSYQDSFTIKKLQKINIKQLDCYQDKFKNLKIPLIHQTNSFVYSPPKGRLKTSESEIQKKKSQTIEPIPYISNLSTENRINFTGEDNNIRSEIKHKKVTDLKYAFKAAIHV